MIKSQSIERTFRIIELLAYDEGKEEFNLSDISEAISLNISTTHRYLEDLIKIGLIEKNEKNKQYRLTLELFKLGNNILYKRSGNIVTNAIQSIKSLFKQYNETINLYTFERNHAICVYRIENTTNSVSYSIRIGSQHPAYCTAAGKIFLAHRGKDFTESYFKNTIIKKYTQNTQIDVNEIKKSLLLIKKDGYALDKEEYIDGANCIAVPIFNNENEVDYAMSIVLSRSKVGTYNFIKIVNDLKKTARDIVTNISC